MVIKVYFVLEFYYVKNYWIFLYFICKELIVIYFNGNKIKLLFRDFMCFVVNLDNLDR